MSRRNRGSSTSGLLGAFQDRSDLSKPQVLTLSSIQALTFGFDARDTLECYLLSRQAHLGGVANSTLPVNKLALGLRYHPPPGGGGRKKALELTLEYGPARAGDGLMLETIPQVVVAGGDNNNKIRRAAPLSATPELTSSSATTDKGQTTVSWDNRAVVYYTLRIDGYRGADYVASMTGAVLKNLLQTALAYPLQRSRRRYQPFAVYRRSAASTSNVSSTTSSSTTTTSAASDVMVLRSSSDLDFVNALWKHLSEVGVELKPVILPPRYKVHLVASGIRKVPVPAAAPAPGNDKDPAEEGSSSSSSSSLPRATAVIDFYQRLYQCVEAMATANYSAYEVPAPLPPTNATRRLEEQVGDEVGIKEVSAQESVPGDEADTEGTPSLGGLDETDELDAGNATNAEPSEGEEEGASLPTGQGDESDNPPPPIDTDQVAQDAQQAAHDAETAAQEAQNSGNEQAAQAAQAAADAAKKAADSTRGQAAMVAQKALLSGDGSSMAEAISQCLSAPRYGIARNDSNVTTVYLYWDGTTYYAINLTAPYIRIVSETSQLPRPSQHFADALSVSQGDGGGDYIDWVIAFAFLLLFVAGLFCLIQKVLGRKLQLSRSLYQFQRWFFDPVHYTLREAKDPTEWDSSDKMERNGEGHTYTFAEDVIPLSMGGRMGWGTDFILGSVASSPAHPDTSDSMDEVEMVEARAKKLSDEFAPDELLDGNGFLSQSSSASPVFLRNPDFVALPDLTRSSKVAVPISLHSSSRHSRDSDSDSDD